MFKTAQQNLKDGCKLIRQLCHRKIEINVIQYIQFSNIKLGVGLNSFTQRLQKQQPETRRVTSKQQLHYLTINGPNRLEISKINKDYLQYVLQYLGPACEVETKNHRIHCFPALNMREMRETALRNLLGLEVVNDIVEDIIEREEAVAPLKKLKVVSLYDIE